MHIKNEIWQVEKDEDGKVTLYFHERESLVFQVTVGEFCALGALIKQMEAAIK